MRIAVLRISELVAIIDQELENGGVPPPPDQARPGPAQHGPAGVCWPSPAGPAGRAQPAGPVQISEI